MALGKIKNIGAGAGLGSMVGMGPAGALLGGAIGQDKIQNALLGKIPEKEVVGLDADTAALMDAQAGRAGRSVDEIAGEAVRGTEGFRQDLASQLRDQARFSSGLAMSEPEDFSKALDKRATGAFDYSQKNLRSQAKLNAGAQKAGMMSSAAEYAAVQSQIKAQALQAARDAAQAKKAQRAALYGMVFGTAGTFAGAALGGAGGAGLGQGLGQGAGQVLGGQARSQKNIG